MSVQTVTLSHAAAPAASASSAKHKGGKHRSKGYRGQSSMRPAQPHPSNKQQNWRKEEGGNSRQQPRTIETPAPASSLANSPAAPPATHFGAATPTAEAAAVPPLVLGRSARNPHPRRPKEKVQLHDQASAAPEAPSPSAAAAAAPQPATTNAAAARPAQTIRLLGPVTTDHSKKAKSFKPVTVSPGAGSAAATPIRLEPLSAAPHTPSPSASLTAVVDESARARIAAAASPASVRSGGSQQPRFKGVPAHVVEWISQNPDAFLRKMSALGQFAVARSADAISRSGRASAAGPSPSPFSGAASASPFSSSGESVPASPTKASRRQSAPSPGPAASSPVEFSAQPPIPESPAMVSTVALASSVESADLSAAAAAAAYQPQPLPVTSQSSGSSPLMTAYSSGASGSAASAAYDDADLAARAEEYARGHHSQPPSPQLHDTPPIAVVHGRAAGVDADLVAQVQQSEDEQRQRAAALLRPSVPAFGGSWTPF
jgi:hypothetical protein